MAIKYKVRLRDLKLEYLKEYIAPIFNFLKPKKKITNISELKNFIQRKSAWVAQETLYGYLKTRMGAKYILMFDDEIFLEESTKSLFLIRYERTKRTEKKLDEEKKYELFLNVLSLLMEDQQEEMEGVEREEMVVSAKEGKGGVHVDKGFVQVSWLKKHTLGHYFYSIIIVRLDYMQRVYLLLDQI